MYGWNRLPRTLGVQDSKVFRCRGMKLMATRLRLIDSARAAHDKWKLLLWMYRFDHHVSKGS